MVDAAEDEVVSMRLDEAAIKASVLTALWQRRRMARDAVIANEFRIGNTGVRADLAVLDGHFIGVEIKSEFDSLKRLDRQVAVYNRFFDEVILVISDSHVRKLAFADCSGAEVWSVGEDGALRVIAEAQRPIEVDYERLSDLMTVAERGRYLQSLERQDPDQVQAAFAAAFHARFGATSRKFWHGLQGPIEPSRLALLSRFKPARDEDRIRHEASAHAWDAWNKQAAALFGS